MPSYRENEELSQRMSDLLAQFPNKTAIIEAGVALLHQQQFPEQHPEPPSVIGWDRIILAKSARCSETGADLPIGTAAYREVWDDGREGAIVSRESLIADGVGVE